jgi:peptidyl-tRNA hydrolase, PTH1 family
MNTFLIVGLGNIGNNFVNTRHNIGFRIVDSLADKYKASFVEGFLSYKTELMLQTNVLHIIKPTTYVNESGEAVKYWFDLLKIKETNLLIVVDDKDLPFGRIRIKPSGGDGRHNGLRNIIEEIGTNQFPRLRFGIGSNFEKGMQKDFVLGKWTLDEFEMLDELLSLAVEIIESFVLRGIERTMTKFNSQL